MGYYKILRMDDIQSVAGVVLDTKVTEILKIQDFDHTDEMEEKIIKIIREYEDGKCEDTHFIAKYSDKGKYEECVGVMFGEIDDGEEKCEPFLDCAEHDMKVYCDMAHRHLTDKQKWNDIIRVADQFGLMNNIIELINVWYDENEL